MWVELEIYRVSSTPITLVSYRTINEDRRSGVWYERCGAQGSKPTRLWPSFGVLEMMGIFDLLGLFGSGEQPLPKFASRVVL